MPKDKNFVKTSIKQPRELWNKIRNDAINQGTTSDKILTTILEEHYGVVKP